MARVLQQRAATHPVSCQPAHASPAALSFSMVRAAPSHCSLYAWPSPSAICCLSCACPCHAQVARHDQDLCAVDSKQILCMVPGACWPCARVGGRRQANGAQRVPGPSAAAPAVSASPALARAHTLIHQHSKAYSLTHAHSPLSTSPCSRSGLWFMAKQQEPLNLKLAACVRSRSGSGAAHTAQSPSQLSCVVGWGYPAHTRVGLPCTHSHD